jgi:hypothetical protein
MPHNASDFNCAPVQAQSHHVESAHLTAQVLHSEPACQLQIHLTYSGAHPLPCFGVIHVSGL